MNYKAIIRSIVNIVRSAITLPTRASLTKTCVVSAVLTLYTFIAKLLGYATFLNPYGALLCTVILMGIIIYERRLTLHGTFRSISNTVISTGKTVLRTKGTGPCVSASGDDIAHIDSAEESGELNTEPIGGRETE